jgi:glycerophosphoryl diester phosphodiesterase
MQIIAHRGASRECPENTLHACERAIAVGIDKLEVDLLLSKDGRIVLRHDDIILHKGQQHYVSELTFAELQQIDVGQGERIPCLEEFLERCYGRTTLVLDIKAAGMAQPLVSLLTGRRMTQHMHITSFLHEEVYLVHEHCPDVERSVTLAAMPISFLQIIQQSAVRTVNLFRGYINHQVVKHLLDMEVCVWAYPVDWPREAEIFSTWGIEAIFTPDPASMQSLRASSMTNTP